MNQIVKEKYVTKFLCVAWLMKCFFFQATFVDAIILLTIVGVNLFHFYQDDILKAAKASRDKSDEMNDRFAKIENQVSQLALQKGFNRNG